MPADIIPVRFLDQARIRPDAPAYHVRTAGSWQTTSWSAYVDEARRAARALIALGFEPGNTVCILGFNRPEWVVADHAAMLAGGAAAGIYTTCSPDEVQYIIDHAESPVVFVENAEQWEKIHARLEKLPRLRFVVTMRGAPRIDHRVVLSWDAFLSHAASVEEAALEARIEAIQENALAQLIYTSGTTGPPKAVMLSHKSVAWTASFAHRAVDLSSEDSSLSYLPLSHIAEQMFTIHAPATSGCQIYFAESMEKLLDNLREVQPTVLFGVPRVWEKFYAGVSVKLGEATGVKKRIADWAMAVGEQTSQARNEGRRLELFLRFKHAIADRLVFKKVKTAIGLGRVRACVVGAAPIAADVLRFFGKLDVVIHEVYGQSEDCGPTSFNLPGRTKFGTVGPVLDGVEVRIAEDGEILVRGPNVFLGYYKDEEATRETLIDGWLHSGDLGAIDNDGFLAITGRKKEIIITAGGKNIAPKNIEMELKQSDLIAEAVVIGDRRRFLSALLVLDDEAARRFGEAKGLSGDLKKQPELVAEIQRAVDNSNEKFARVEHIRKWRVLPRSLTIADGELTPTLKIKRRKVEEHFREILDEIYAEDEPVPT